MFEGLPSESPRRRRLLYLAEGLAIGGGVAYVLVETVGTILWLTESRLSIPILLFGLVFLLLALRNVGFIQLDRKAGDQRTKSPVKADWSETRRWKWVGLISVIVGLALFTISVTIWGLENVLYLYAMVNTAGPTILLGLGLWMYGIYGRSGGN